jgi:L-fuconolactonase
MKVIDSHQHFWLLERGDYDWLTPELGILRRDYMPDELMPLLASHAVDRTILVQAAATEAETHFLLTLAHQYPFIAGIIGWVEFSAAGAAGRIGRLVASGQGRLKGLRPMVQNIPDPQWLLRTDLDAAFAALVTHDLVFDALVRVPQINALRVRLLRNPSVRAVLDHAGKPNIVGGEFEVWAKSITRLASETSACCKLSGLLSEAGREATFDHLAPYVEHVFAQFGPDRVLWGSDWPVLNLVADYQRWLDLSREFVARFASGHEHRVFATNAAQLYRLPH